MATEWMAYADIGRRSWGSNFEKHGSGGPLNPSTEALSLAALYRLVELATHNATKQAQVLNALATLRPPAVPVLPAAPTPAEVKAAREAESRRRAWAAYKRAGGTMEPEADGDTVALTDSVRVLNLSVRARKALNKLNCSTLADVVKYSGDELLELKNFGKTSLDEVRARLARFGLALRGEQGAK